MARGPEKVSPFLWRGRIELFSTDALSDLLARLGVTVKLVAKPSKRRLDVA